MAIKVENVIFLLLILLLIKILFKLSDHKRTDSAPNLKSKVDLSNIDYKKSLNYYRQTDFVRPAVSWFANHTYNNSIPDLRKYRLKPDPGSEIFIYCMTG